MLKDPNPNCYQGTPRSWLFQSYNYTLKAKNTGGVFKPVFTLWKPVDCDLGKLEQPLSIFGLGVDMYTLTIEEHFGCPQVVSFELRNFDPTKNFTVIDECKGLADGAIKFNVNNGGGGLYYDTHSTYSFQCDNGQTATHGQHSTGINRFDDLSAGKYCITVTDQAKRCAAVKTCVEVMETKTEVSADGCTTYCLKTPKKVLATKLDGLINLIGMTGCNPQKGVKGNVTFLVKSKFTYEVIRDGVKEALQQGNLTPDNNTVQLTEGDYTIIVTDGTCFKSFPIIMNCCTGKEEPQKLSQVIITPNMGNSSGAIEIVDGYFLPGAYYYHWKGPNGFESFSKNIAGLPTGEYCLEYITGDCLDTQTFCYTIINGTTCKTPSFSVDVVEKACGPLAQGEVEINGLNLEDFDYFVSSSTQTTQNIPKSGKIIYNLEVGTYTINFKNKKDGCSFTRDFTITDGVKTFERVKNSCDIIIRCEGQKIQTIKGSLLNVSPGQDCKALYTCSDNYSYYDEGQLDEYFIKDENGVVINCTIYRKCKISGEFINLPPLEANWQLVSKETCKESYKCQPDPSNNKLVAYKDILYEVTNKCSKKAIITLNDEAIPFFQVCYDYAYCNGQRIDITPKIPFMGEVNENITCDYPLCSFFLISDNDGIQKELNIYPTESKILAITDIRVFPNPFEEELNMYIGLEKPETVQVNLYDAIGKLIYHENTALNTGVNFLKIKPETSYQGLMIIEIKTTDGTMFNQKLFRLAH